MALMPSSASAGKMAFSGDRVARSTRFAGRRSGGRPARGESSRPPPRTDRCHGRSPPSPNRRSRHRVLDGARGRGGRGDRCHDVDAEALQAVGDEVLQGHGRGCRRPAPLSSGPRRAPNFTDTCSPSRTARRLSSARRSRSSLWPSRRSPRCPAGDAAVDGVEDGRHARVVVDGPVDARHPHASEAEREHLRACLSQLRRPCVHGVRPSLLPRSGSGRAAPSSPRGLERSPQPFQASPDLAHDRAGAFRGRPRIAGQE